MAHQRHRFGRGFVQICAGRCRDDPALQCSCCFCAMAVVYRTYRPAAAKSLCTNRPETQEHFSAFVSIVCGRVSELSHRAKLVRSRVANVRAWLREKHLLRRFRMCRRTEGRAVTARRRPIWKSCFPPTRPPGDSEFLGPPSTIGWAVVATACWNCGGNASRSTTCKGALKDKGGFASKPEKYNAYANSCAFCPALLSVENQSLNNRTFPASPYRSGDLTGGKISRTDARQECLFAFTADQRSESLAPSPIAAQSGS